LEPDWRRLPGYREVTPEEWESALWQRKHTVKNLKELQQVFGPLLPESLLRGIERDQRELATMSLLVPPQMLNTMNERDLWNDPLRRYLLPAFEDRDVEWPSHPKAQRDSLHEAEMWAVEGLTHRYPTKVLAEVLATCPQYCGHCTLKRTPAVRDVVVSGGDIANLPIATLEGFVSSLMDLPSIRDIRLATKGLVGLPQHFLQDDVLRGLERLSRKARQRGIDIAVHTHANHTASLTPLVARAVTKLLDMGYRDVRNQGVLMRGINCSSEALLDLCFTLLDHAGIMPYYFYMCDMIPNSEHWRLAVHEAQELQHDIMGYLPGFATPRITCDVPFVGKRWVHQVQAYDREKGISYWTKNYRTGIEADDPEALSRQYEYYDPVYTLPEAGQAYWRGQRTRA
jgi:lysine 2,3-aminomutase